VRSEKSDFLTRRALSLFLTVGAVLFSCLVAFPARAEEDGDGGLRIMTFNIRTISPRDGKDIWFNRRKEVAKLIQGHEPDIAGLQEVTHVQLKHLEEDLPGYKWFGLARDDGKDAGERCPIFYKPDVVEVLEQGTFWLSETPEKPGSISWDSVCRRIATWALFKEKKTGQSFCFMNTHFDHVGKEAREESAHLVRGWLTEKAYQIPAILVGDFNCVDRSVAYQTLASYFNDAREVTDTPPKGPEGTTRPFFLTSKPGRRIDYIFVSEEVKALEYAVLDDTYGEEKRRPSDHMPVLVVATLLAG